MKRIAAVVVTFNNAPMLKNLLSDLAGQTFPIEKTIVVDNASRDDTPRLLAEEFPWVVNIRLPENTGSAGGYHAGLKAAMEFADGIWTLDDDLRLPPDSIKKLVEGYAELSKKHRLGAVRSTSGNYSFAGPVELVHVPWRGTLWAGTIVREMGPPRADYFLYGEDLEYSLRMHKYGYHCFWVPSSECVDVRMEKTEQNILGKEVSIYRTPFRFFYAFRNELNIYIEYRRLDKIARLGLYAVKVIGFLLFTEGIGGSGKIAAVITGLLHGVSGRLGKNTHYIP